MARSNSDQMPLFSILVPVYNSESTIKECLDSIMALKYPREKLEVIVVDDASTDKTSGIDQKLFNSVSAKRTWRIPFNNEYGIRVAKGDVI